MNEEMAETTEVVETHLLEEMTEEVMTEEVMTEEVMTEVMIVAVTEMTEEVEVKEDSVLQEIPITVLLLKISLLAVAGKILKTILEPLVTFASLMFEEEETEDKWESLNTNIMMT